VTSVGSATYGYNGLDQRVQKTVGGVAKSSVLADDSIDSQVLSDGNATYAHGQGLIGEVRAGVSSIVHTDDLGSVRAQSNGAGSVTATKSTDAFGNVFAAGSSGTSNGSPFGFAGSSSYQQDGESGLMRLGYRMYDASVGRFLSRDPIRDGYNWYTYCENDPVNTLDSEGLQASKKKTSSPDDPYKGPKPPYVNPGHHDTTQPGKFRGGGGGNTSILPSDAEDVYKGAIPGPMIKPPKKAKQTKEDYEKEPWLPPKTWWGKNAKGVIYRYQVDSDGTAHWTGDNTPPKKGEKKLGLVVPADVLKRLSK
jgi:RHS repeat-associated protein